MSVDCVKGPTYRVDRELVKFAIPYMDKATDEYKMLRIQQVHVKLIHSSGDVVTFKRYKRKGDFVWGDSRCPGQHSFDYVIAEVARMLYRGDKVQARQLLVELIN